MSSVQRLVLIALMISVASSQADARRRVRKSRHHARHSASAPKVSPPQSTREQGGSSSAEAPLVTHGPRRVDFDDRLLQGQTNRLGAVYLYHRKNPVLPSLLDEHKSFREEIKRDVLE